jgi:hypothetical protein
MSWDIAIVKFARIYRTLDEMPRDEPGQSLGPREDVHRAVLAVFPGTNWSDPGWGQWASEFGSIEFNLGEEDITSLMLHVRAGDEVVPGIVELCRNNGWQGIDAGAGDIIDQMEHPVASVAAWKSYRNQMVRSS